MELGHGLPNRDDHQTLGTSSVVPRSLTLNMQEQSQGIFPSQLYPGQSQRPPGFEGHWHDDLKGPLQGQGSLVSFSLSSLSSSLFLT